MLVGGQSNCTRARWVLAVAVFTVLLVPDSSSGTTTKTGISETVRAKLLDVARSEAALRGERHPYEIQAVLTTQRLAARLEGEGRRVSISPRREGQKRAGTTGVDGEVSRARSGARPVYFIAMKGTFTFLCFGPAPCPPAPVLMLTLSVSTKQVLNATKWGENYPNLKSVGAPVQL